MNKFDMLRFLTASLYAQAVATAPAAQAGQSFTPPSADLLTQWADANFLNIYMAGTALAAPPFRLAEVTALIDAVVKASNGLKALGVPGKALEQVAPELVVWAVGHLLPTASRPAWLTLLLAPDFLRGLVKVIYKAADRGPSAAPPLPSPAPSPK